MDRGRKVLEDEKLDPSGLMRHRMKSKGNWVRRKKDGMI